MFQWLRRRQEARRLAEEGAELLICDYGPEDAYQVAQALKRKAQDCWSAAHWRRVARAIVRMTGKLVEY